MGVLGPNNATTFVDDSSVGLVAWQNPANAQINDGTSATAAALITQQTHYLQSSGYQFSVPMDATVDGITVEVLRSASIDLGMTDTSVRIMQSGTITGGNRSSGTGMPAAGSYIAYGGSTDQWDVSWGPGDINNPGFGFVISASASVASTANIDHVRITVYYTGSNRPTGFGDCTARVKSGDGMSLNL